MDEQLWMRFLFGPESTRGLWTITTSYEEICRERNFSIRGPLNSIWLSSIKPLITWVSSIYQKMLLFSSRFLALSSVAGSSGLKDQTASSCNIEL